MAATSRALFATFLLVAVTPAKTAESPEQVLLAFSAAMLTEGAAATLPRYMHPDECARFKDLFMPRFREAAKAGEEFRKDILGETYSLKEIEAMPPAVFMRKFLWRSGMQGKDVKPPRILMLKIEGDIALLDTVTDYTTFEGQPAKLRGIARLKAFGDTWKLMLTPELETTAIAFPVTN